MIEYRVNDIRDDEFMSSKNLIVYDYLNVIMDNRYVDISARWDESLRIIEENEIRFGNHQILK